MGKWADEFQKQLGQFEREKMNARNALQLIAYWAGELGLEKSGPRWAPLVLKVMRETPPPTHSFFQKLILKEPLIENRAAKAFRSIFDTEPKRPAVTADVRAEVLDFMQESALRLDITKPNVRVPRFKKSEFSQKGFELLLKAPKFLLQKKKKKPGFGVGAILLLLLIASKGKRNR